MSMLLSEPCQGPSCKPEDDVGKFAIQFHDRQKLGTNYKKMF